MRKLDPSSRNTRLDSKNMDRAAKMRDMSFSPALNVLEFANHDKKKAA